MWEKLEELAARYQDLERQLGDPEVLKSPERLKEAGRELAELRELIEVYNQAKDVEGQIEDALELIHEPDPEMAALAKPENMSKSIYVVHMPPANLGLGTVASGADVGSQAVYEFTKANQPLLLLSGHIHESPQVSGIWRAELGSTVCIQPGQQEDLTYVNIDLSSMETEIVTESLS